MHRGLQYPAAHHTTPFIQKFDIDKGNLISMFDRTKYPGLHTYTVTKALAPAFTVTISKDLYATLKACNNGNDPITMQWRDLLISWKKGRVIHLAEPGLPYIFDAPVGHKEAMIPIRFLHLRDLSNRRYYTFSLANGDSYAPNN